MSTPTTTSTYVCMWFFRSRPGPIYHHLSLSWSASASRPRLRVASTMLPWEEGVMECARRLPPLGGGASQSLFLFRVRCIALPCPIHPSRPSAILSSAFGPTRIATLRLLPPCFGCLSMYPQLSPRRCFASRRSSFLSSSSLFRFARSSLTSVCPRGNRKPNRGGQES